jgi:hypothetical protein
MQIKKGFGFSYLLNNIYHRISDLGDRIFITNSKIEKLLFKIIQKETSEKS